MNAEVKGVLPVAHTPFDDEDRIDWQSLERQVEWAFSVGADGCCTGMVSELLRLTTDERLTLTSKLASLCHGKGAFVASVGAESSKQACAFAVAAESAGASAVMAIPPISSAIPDEELIRYFCKIADAIQLPIVVQDASGYVGKAIPMNVYLELLDRYGAERILFKPECSPVGPVISELRMATEGAASVFEGSGGNLLIDNFRRGITGTIPGMEFLEGIVSVWQSLSSGDEEHAYRVYFPICALVTLQLQAGLDGFLAVEKYVLHQRGLFATAARRRPYSWSLDEETRSEVDRLLQRLQDALSYSEASDR